MGTETVVKPSPGDLRFHDVINPQGNVWDHPAAVTPHIKVNDGVAGSVLTSGRKKIALVGFASGTRSMAPFDDPTWEVWGLNQLYRHITRADRWFDIHSNYYDHVVDGTDHVAWLEHAPIPVYMNVHHPEFSTSVRFPIDRAMRYFGKPYAQGSFDYYTSTVAFMLALAIMEGATDIGIFGIDLIVGTEYFVQKACVEFYLGFATCQGIRLHIPKESALLHQDHRYGYELPSKQLIEGAEYTDRRKKIMEKRDQLHIQQAILDGAAQEDEYWEQIHILRARGAAGKEDPTS